MCEQRGNEAYTSAEQAFTDYFVRNYPGPDTVIFDPRWHAPKLFAAAARFIREATLSPSSPALFGADAVYVERNQVVAALSKLFPAGQKRTRIGGLDDAWHNCVYIDLPTGQVSWHFHDRDAEIFAHLPQYEGEWDGHDTPEKYRRVAALASPQPSSHVAPEIDGGRFEEWTLKDFAAQCRMQSRELLDPEFSRFMAALAKRLSALAPAPEQRGA